MHHRRGIDLEPSVSNIPVQRDRVTSLGGAGVESPAGLVEWMMIGGVCGRCKRHGWIDPNSLRRKFGSQSLVELTPLLKCRRCWNKGDSSGNRWIVGKMPR